MERLSKIPYLALKEIVQPLTPEDLVHCSTVCRDWHEAFNHDWIWKPHCNPELEEPLRTIPSVATPAFVTPKYDNSTLPPGPEGAHSTRTIPSDATSTSTPEDGNSTLPPAPSTRTILSDVTNAFVTTEDGNSTLPPGPKGAPSTRTIPSDATSAYLTSEVKKSKLSRICPWRLAFMRETHLWNNWKNNKMLLESENALRLKNDKNDIKGVNFVKDTLIVVWRSHSIEIFDVSEKSFVCKAKTDVLVKIRDYDQRYVIDATMLFVDKMFSFEVYTVDMMTQRINLRNCIVLLEPSEYPARRPALSRLHKGHLFLLADDQRAVLSVFDLNTGGIIKESPYPVMLEENEKRVDVAFMKSSSTSDFVAVAIAVFRMNSDERRSCTFIYSIERLTFLMDFEIKAGYPNIMHRHWLTFSGRESMFTTYLREMSNRVGMVAYILTCMFGMIALCS